MKKEEKTVTDKVGVLKDYHEVVEKLIAESKREKDNLDQQIQLKRIELKRLGDEHTRLESVFGQKMREEARKLEEEKNQWKNERIKADYSRQIGEAEYKKRTEELAQMEKSVVGLVDEKNKLNLQRIDVEKLHVKATELLRDAEFKMDEALKKLDTSSKMEKEAKEFYAKAKQLNDNLQIEKEKIILDKKDLEQRKSNLEEIQKVIEPKIKELEFTENKLKEKEAEVRKLNNEVNARLQEEASIIKGLDEREKRVKEKERENLQKEEELARKALLAGIK